MSEEYRWRTEEASNIARRLADAASDMRRLDDTLAHYVRENYAILQEVRALGDALGEPKELPDPMVQQPGGLVALMRKYVLRVQALTGLPALVEVRDV